jgi:SAM-dependent methyltransferase
MMFQMVRPKGRILDIGCGTGLAIEWIKNLDPANYVGIDPCKKMIEQLVWKHPRYAPCIRSCFFEEYYGRGFDTIIALFGTASYFRDAERVMDMLNDGGVATLVYYASDYEPVTDKLTGVNGGAVVSRPKGDNVINWGNYVIERWVK